MVTENPLSGQSADPSASPITAAGPETSTTSGPAVGRDEVLVAHIRDQSAAASEHGAVSPVFSRFPDDQTFAFSRGDLLPALPLGLLADLVDKLLLGMELPTCPHIVEQTEAVDRLYWPRL